MFKKHYKLIGIGVILITILKYALLVSIITPFSIKYGPSIKRCFINVFNPSKIIKESGRIVTENRTFADFEKIKISGNGNLIIGKTQNDGLTIEGDSNIIEKIETQIKGKTLIIRPKKGLILNSENMNYLISAQKIKEIELKGNIKCELSNISKDAIKMYVHNTNVK